MAVRVALAGATGNLGPAILKVLLDANFQVTILSREGSISTDSIASHPNQSIVKVDYTSVSSLTDALQGHAVVVSTLASTALDTQQPLIDAALAAGIARFIPSEFGSDLNNTFNQALPVFGGKMKVQAYLKDLAAKNNGFSYTLIYNNAFFDWGLNVGFIVDPKEHKATIYDGGDVPFSVTRLSSIGKAVAGVINNLDATKNRVVYIHDAVVTQNQLIKIFKSVDDKDWETETKSTQEIAKASYEELGKPEPNYSTAMVGFLFSSAFSEKGTPDFRGRVDNKLLGLPELNEEELKEVLKGFL